MEPNLNFQIMIMIIINYNSLSLRIEYCLMRNIVTQLDLMFVHDTLHELHLNKYKGMPLVYGG